MRKYIWYNHRASLILPIKETMYCFMLIYQSKVQVYIFNIIRVVLAAFLIILVIGGHSSNSCYTFDKVGTIYIYANPILHSKMKHIRVDFHFVREKVVSDELHVCHVSSQEQLAMLWPSHYQGNILNFCGPSLVWFLIP